MLSVRSKRGNTMIECPDIAIVGVPKAGTTSLHRWLENLESVSAACPKETFYFMDEGNAMTNPKGSYRRQDGLEYHNFFHAGLSKTKRSLDSTTHHFYQRTAVEKFAENGTKVCVVLREPVSRLVSYFNYVGFARSGFVTSIDFSLFVEKLIDGDFQSLRPAFADEREFFSMRTSLDQGNYQKYLKRWRARFPQKNLKVMFFEDLVERHQFFLGELASFFQLEHTVSDFADFQIQNEGRSVKFPALNRVLRSASHYVSALPFYEPLKQRYACLQRGEKLEFDWLRHRAAIARLCEYYRPLNEKLGELVPFDPQRWAVEKHLSTSDELS